MDEFCNLGQVISFDSHFVVCKIRALDLMRWFLRTIHILWLGFRVQITQTSLESNEDRQITQRVSDPHATLERKLSGPRAYPGKEKFSLGNYGCKARGVFGVFKKWQGRGCSWSRNKGRKEGYKLGWEVANGQIMCGGREEGECMCVWCERECVYAWHGVCDETRCLCGV